MKITHRAVFSTPHKVNDDPFIFRVFSSCYSAGIGRTGTFIALDSLLDMGQAEGEVDVFQFVSQTRMERMHMIQTQARPYLSTLISLTACISPLLCYNKTIYIYSGAVARASDSRLTEHRFKSSAAQGKFVYPTLLQFTQLYE